MRHLRRTRAALAALCAGILVGAALWPAARTGDAHGPTHGGDGPAHTPGWTVLAPVTYKNLTIFPVRGRSLAGAQDYITLDEGIKNGTVRITEKGAWLEVELIGPSKAIEKALAYLSEQGVSVEKTA